MPRPYRRSNEASPRGYQMPHSTPDMSIVKSELTPSPHLLDHGYGATPINQIVPSGNTASAGPPSVKRKLNLETDHHVVPLKHEFKTPQPKRAKRPTTPKKNTRYDTSLSLLTQRFSELLSVSEDGVVDLNEASRLLNVQKRRIYDITNVLEGIGILEKKSKNNIRWKGGRDRETYLSMKKRNQQLENQENLLDRLISETKSHLCNLDQKLGYVTYQDLRSIDRFRQKTVMAIKAPPNTHLNVPQSGPGGDSENKYSFQLKSENGEIEVFLCSENVSPPRPKVPPVDPLLRDIKLSPGIGIFDMTTPPMPQLDSPATQLGGAAQNISSQICRNLSFSSKDSPPSSTLYTSNSTNSSASTSCPAQSSSSSTSNLSSVQNNFTKYNLSTIRNKRRSPPVEANDMLGPPTRLSPLMYYSGSDSPTDSASSGNGTGASSSANGSTKRVPFVHDNIGLGPMVGRFTGISATVPSTSSSSTTSGVASGDTCTSYSGMDTSSQDLMDPFFGPEPFIPLEPLMQPEYYFSYDTNEGLADLFDDCDFLDIK